MPKFQPGNSGRPKGAQNVNTKLVKDVFAEVFDKLQEKPDEKYSLLEWGKENPTPFYNLAAKLIPVQISGDRENPLQFELRKVLVFDDKTEPEV